MENTKAKELFDSQFKFMINQEVRHKGDTKNGHSSDMGLLVLSRFLAEDVDDDGNTHFHKHYQCRMIRFSGSGDTQNFIEKELLSMKEYNEKMIDQEDERNWMRQQMKDTGESIFALFGVKRYTEVYLKKDGVVDKTATYKVTGWSSGGNDVPKIKVTRELSIGKESESIGITSKEEFEVVVTDKEK